MTDVVPYTPHDSILIAEDSFKLAQRVAGTEFVPKSLRGKPEAVLACILTGHEIGIGPMMSLSKIHVVDGRPGMAAELMRTLILRAGHEIYIEDATNTRVTVTGIRSGTGRSLSITWTMDDARRAGLAGKNNWKGYPRAMLTARATSEVARGLFPDALGGISYTEEELEEFDDTEDDTGTKQDPTPAAKTPAKKRTRKAVKAVAAKKAARPEPLPAPEPSSRAIPPLPGQEFEPHTGDAVEIAGEIIDAVIVDEKDAQDPEPENVQIDPSDEFEDGVDEPRFSGPALIAMKMQKAGIDREEKLAYVGAIIGREIESTKELSNSELILVLQSINDTVGDDDDDDSEDLDVDQAAETDPDQWGTTEWRAALKSNGWKLTDVLRAADAAAVNELTSSPTSLAAIAGTGLAAAIIDRMNS